MIGNCANRLLMLGEVHGSGRRYHVGITSVLRRCMVGRDAVVNMALGRKRGIS
jgi:hypothetical protein